MTETVNITLPRDEVLILLQRSIQEVVTRAKLLEFNRENEQWDLMSDNLAKMEPLQRVIEECARGLEKWVRSK